jgi:hypothetical protein
MTIRPDPAKIVVPRRQGEVLMEPSLCEMEAAAAHGAGGSESRRRGREHLLAAAAQWRRIIGADPPSGGAFDGPFILSGHQVEFYHPGVWAKVIIADELAKRTGGMAFDLLVDHDTVDHLGFDVPRESAGGEWAKRMIEFAPASSLPADALRAPGREQFEQWEAALASFPSTHTDTMAFWLGALAPGRETGDGGPATGYSAWLSRARRRYEASLGIQAQHVPTSLLCAGPLWREFVHTWISHASDWTAAYNGHVEAYRRGKRIRSPNRPMPNLAREISGNGGTYELPFWIYAPGSARQRLMVETGGGASRILFQSERLGIGEVGAEDSGFVIRPRALTLTMYARLYFADFFIHGIGGALYDQITDGLLGELFGDVPSYGCVSAAWLLPLGEPADPEDVSALAHRRHHLEHNPQLALDAFTAGGPPAAVSGLLAERARLIEEIGRSLRGARRDRGEKLRRRGLFKQLHATNADLHAQMPAILRNLDHQLAAARHAAAQNKILQDREFFLGLHTTQSLRKLIRLLRG